MLMPLVHFVVSVIKASLGMAQKHVMVCMLLQKLVEHLIKHVTCAKVCHVMATKKLRDVTVCIL